MVKYKSQIAYQTDQNLGVINKTSISIGGWNRSELQKGKVGAEREEKERLQANLQVTVNWI